MRVVVAGGGLVGLTAAAALGQAGHEVTVVEQASEIRAAGAGIGLWENALREFDRLGIGADVRSAGHEIDAWFFDAAGRPVRPAGYGDDAHRFLFVARPELNVLLADAVGPQRIRLGDRVTGFTETGDGVRVLLESGRHLDADLLVGADGVHSKVRAALVPDSAARPDAGHYAWRAVIPAGAERPEGTVLTVGRDRTRGGYSRLPGDRTMWMVNQFDVGELPGTPRDRALARAHNLAENGWHDELLRMIEATPEDAILENPILLVPELPHWTSAHVALIGDAAHGLSPHISAGGTLGVEDVGVLRACLSATADLPTALREYERRRRERFARVREFSAEIEFAADAGQFARRYAAFSHWMLTTAPYDEN
ncbi:Aurachin C monooxygenase/isomerase [Nocardia sp. RB20]|uniref:Aurachin C monooxygenase/isomerase n=2 Tax=Nocardia macrotermitis TaxID=2585198 RepID=A0A7K0D8G5_9NOCA|nr:FAD-dependent monooxygenase [Nocardia macrotermitis]MQY21841.1 Aurachin C monooxygenase/isomerase [Nocardia macrotermitis]